METKLEISDFFKTTPKMTTIKLRQNKQQQQQRQQQKMRDHDHYDQNELTPKWSWKETGSFQVSTEKGSFQTVRVVSNYRSRQN